MKLLTGKDKKRLGITRQDTITVVIGVLGLLLGRVAVFGTLNPVAIAFLAGYLLRGYRIYFGAVFVVIGLATRFGGLYLGKYFIAVIIITAIHFILGRIGLRGTKNLRGACAAVAVFIPATIINFILNRGLHYIGLSILEAALAFGLVHLMDRGVKVLEGRHRNLNNESLLSTAIVLGAIASGVADISIWLLSLKHFVTALVVLIVAGKGGATIGATCGVVLGLILTITDSADVTFIGILSVAGMVAGLGKTPPANIAGFAMGWLVTALYLDIAIVNLSLMFSVALAAAVFTFGPKNSIAIGTDTASAQHYLNKTKEHMEGRIWAYASSFKKLAGVISPLKRKYSLTQDDISIVIDKVVNSTCINCTKRDKCWGANFYSTYQELDKVVESWDKKTRHYDPVKDFCIQADRLLSGINYHFQIFKNNMSWQNRVQDTKELASRQLQGVGEILSGMASSVAGQLRFMPYIERQILAEFSKNRMEVDSVIVIENSSGKYEVDIKYRGTRKIVDYMLQIVSKITGRQMIEDTPVGTHGLRFVEQQQFRVNTGLARASKEEGTQSGDSHSAMHINGNTCLLMLSDGMGSGSRAKAESATTVEIFEDFIGAGFEKDMAIKIINSVLVLKNDEDWFSTLDVCLLDLHTGAADFIKMGAASTYIIREGVVEIIKNTDLPMGILNEVKVSPVKKHLKRGDVLVMITDGVIEPNQPQDREERLIDLLKNSKATDPQELADHIMDTAAQGMGESKIRDDMTVMVAKIVSLNFKSENP